MEHGKIIWTDNSVYYLANERQAQCVILDAYRRWTETQPNLPRTVEGMEELYAAFKQGWIEEKERDEGYRLVRVGISADSFYIFHSEWCAQCNNDDHSNHGASGRMSCKGNAYRSRGLPDPCLCGQ